MITILNIEDNLINKASELFGIKKTTLVKLGFESLIARESVTRQCNEKNRSWV